MAALVLGSLLGSYIHHDYATWSRLGRQEFMAHQMLRFEEYIAVPQPTFHTVARMTVLVFEFEGKEVIRQIFAQKSPVRLTAAI